MDVGRVNVDVEQGESLLLNRVLSASVYLDALGLRSMLKTPRNLMLIRYTLAVPQTCRLLLSGP